MKVNKVAIVTGGSNGIGLSIARQLVDEQMEVVIIGRNLDKLKKACEELGSHCRYCQADVSNQQEVKECINKVINDLGRIDILVNNAGIIQLVSTELALSDADRLWDEVIDTNLKGAMLMTVASAEHLKKTKGKIVNISSIGAFTGGSGKGSLVYSSSKAGVNGLTYATARELSPFGINVNAVAPGVIRETNFNGGFNEENEKLYTQQIPIGRIGEPEDVANAVSFLVSEAATYINGEVMNVNGGWLFGR
ncbi:SDR family NAD(P)-dependent oxidoreductase [Enterococcus sp. AZ192]|uniref:SDR family NAD(P)-dependent oxidoreductase n=1 Tax=unclassified Enterococcus TaxID=2608891 RepID=UPI003D2A176C